MENFSSNLLQELIGSLNNYIFNIYPDLMASFGNFGRAILVLYIVIVGYNIMIGNFERRTNEFITSLILVVLIWTSVFETSFYFEYIVNPFVKLTLTIGTFFIAKNDPSTIKTLFKTLDETAWTLIVFLQDAENSSFLTELRFAVEGFVAKIILLLCFGVMYICYLVLVCVTFFSEYILFLIGGPFIFFAAFKGTRHLFWAWAKTLLFYLVQMALISIVMGLFINNIQEGVETLVTMDANTPIFLSAAFINLVVYCLLSFAVLLTAPLWAMALTGASVGQGGSMIAGAVSAGGAGLAAKSFAAAKVGASVVGTPVAGKAIDMGQRILNSFSASKGLEK